MLVLNKKNSHLLSFDYDGTIYPSTKEMLEVDADSMRKLAIKRGNNCLFLLNTSRSLDSFLSSSLNEEYNFFHYYAFDMGTSLYTRNSKGEFIIVDDFQSFIHGMVKLEAIERDFLFVEKLFGNLLVKDYHSPYKLTFRSPNDSIRFFEELNLHDLSIVLTASIQNSGETFYYDFLPKDLSKKTPIEFLQAKLGIERSQIYSIGDSMNDLGMFEVSGWIILSPHCTLKFRSQLINILKNKNILFVDKHESNSLLSGIIKILDELL